MERNKIILVSVGIVLLALIGFNFNNLTGRATGNLFPDVTVFPGKVNAGEIVEVKVKPRIGCVDPEISFYYTGKDSSGIVSSSGGRKGTVTQKGGFKICNNDKGILNPDGSFTVRYRTEPGWDGEYYAKVYYWKDRNTKDYINAYFNVLK